MKIFTILIELRNFENTSVCCKKMERQFMQMYI